MANVTTPDELIMQQYWPAQEAVAKLRHEAIISEIQGGQLQLRSVLERLNEMERSLAIAPIPAPTIDPTIASAIASVVALAVVSTVGPAGASAIALAGAPAIASAGGPAGGPAVVPPGGLAGSPAVIPPGGPAGGPAVIPPGGPAGGPIGGPAVAPAVGPAVGPAIASAVGPAVAPAGGLAGGPAVGPAVIPINTQQPTPYILDPQAPARPYKMLRGSDSVFLLWTEWTLGLAGGPSIEAFDRCWGARWRIGSEAMFYCRRLKIIREIRRRVRDGMARDERQAVDQLEQLRGQRTLNWLCKNLN